MNAETERPDLSNVMMISSDSHVVENPALWDDVLPRDHWGELTSSFGRKGAYDAEARVPEMDVDGVSAEVLYPSLAMRLFTLDPERQAECFHRYNEWLTAFCDVAPSRLIGVGLIPTYDIDRALDEVRWCDEHGLRGVQIWQSPHPDLPFTSSHYDQFWAECSARRLPVSLHAITGFDHSQKLFEEMADGKLPRGVEFYRVTNACLASVMDSLLDLLFSGALERHASLRVVLVENEVAWIPYALDQWDFFFTKFRGEGAGLQRLPSECFHDHVFATFLLDGNVKHVVRQIGASNVMWSNDYPHDMSTWPGSRDLIRQRLSDLSERELRSILSGNASALYRVEPEESGSGRL